MKINTHETSTIKPITITLETREEIQAIYCLFNHTRISNNFLVKYGKFPENVWKQLKKASPEGTAEYIETFQKLEALVWCKFMPN